MIAVGAGDVAAHTLLSAERPLHISLLPMNPLTTRSRRSASLAPSIEPLETRIAPAAVVSLTAGDLSVIDGVNAVDAISISSNGVNFQFNDPMGITAGAGATQIDPNNVEVPVASVTGEFHGDDQRWR